MSAARLTKWNRSNILNVAIADAFKDKLAKLKEDKHTLGMEVYRSIFPLSSTEALKNVDDKWLCKRDTFYATTFNGQNVDFDLASEEYFHSGNNRYSYSSVGYIKGQDLNDKVTKFTYRKDDLDKEISSARNLLRTLLNSVTTYKQLEKTWPDGKAYYEKYMTTVVYANNVPVVVVDDVNKALGLPKAA